MSKQYDNNMTGVLFTNDKGDNPARPDYTGNVEIEGKKWRVAGWWKTGPKGQFLSLRISEPKPEEGRPTQPARQTPDPNAFKSAPKPRTPDDDVPF